MNDMNSDIDEEKYRNFMESKLENIEDSKNQNSLQDSIKDKLDSKDYRKNVAAVVLSQSYPEKCEFFLAERFDLRGVWQFPQGGIDSGESAREALFRELEEEIGTREVEIIAECKEWVSYDFPPGVAENMKPFKGQVQKYFLVRLKRDCNVDINTKEPEFFRYEFVDFENLMKRINHFKRPVYMRVLSYFRKEGYI